MIEPPSIAMRQPGANTFHRAIELAMHRPGRPLELAARARSRTRKPFPSAAGSILLPDGYALTTCARAVRAHLNPTEYRAVVRGNFQVPFLLSANEHFG
jgi:hypothetical protein